MATTTSVHCDLCKAPATHKQKQIPAKFLTEQTEGRPTTPYLSVQSLDLCNECLRRIVDGQPIVGSGARGHNTFNWR